MKKLNTLFALTLMCISHMVVAQNFEGVITMNTANTKMKEEATVTWYLKGDRSRMDIRSVADGHSSSYSIVMDEKGTHMVAEGHVTEVPAAALNTKGAAQTLLSQQKDNVNGYACTKAVFFDGKHQTTYWLTDDLDISFDDIPAVIRRNMPTVNTEGFPVKMEKRNADGDLVVTQEVISVTRTRVDESRFERN